MILNRLFWIACAGLLGLCLHLAYVLFMPSFEMGRIMARLSAEHGSNQLGLLKPEEVRALFKSDMVETVAAACLFDTGQAPVTIDAVIPDSYWMISVYGASGALLFTLDDRQAGVDRMRFVLRPPDFPLAKPDNDTIMVEAPEGRGLVVLQARAQEPGLVAGLSAALAGSHCGPRE